MLKQLKKLCRPYCYAADDARIYEFFFEQLCQLQDFEVPDDEVILETERVKMLLILADAFLLASEPFHPFSDLEVSGFKTFNHELQC